MFKPLNDACSFGHLDIARYLLDKRADIESTSGVCIIFGIWQGVDNCAHSPKYGCTPLHEACAGNYLDVVRFLVERQANIEAEDRVCVESVLFIITHSIAIRRTNGHLFTMLVIPMATQILFGF